MAGSENRVAGKRPVVRYFVLAFLAEFPVLAACIGLHRLFIYRGALIQSAEAVGGEMSSPTAGRLVFALLAGVLSLVMAFLASKQAGKKHDFRAFIAGAFAGTFLWQCLGEDLWHFSIGGTHFFSPESISVLPLVILYFIAMLYCWRRGSLDWGVWCGVLLFWVNWMGHFILAGIWPLFAPLVSLTVWYAAAGVTLGVILFAAGLILALKKAKTPRQLILCSILCYHGFALGMFGIMGG